MTAIVFLFFFIILASALCSMVEAAILSLSFVRARVLHEQKKPNSKDLLYLKEHVNQTVACIVILNNAINIVGSVFIGYEVTTVFGDEWLGLASTVVTFSIIIFSEIIPKAIGERYKVPLSLFFAKPLRIIVLVMMPVVSTILHITTPLLAKIRHQPRFTEEDIMMMLKLGRAEGSVELDEEVLCNRVFKLNDVRAAQIMKPIDQIDAIAADKTLEEAKEAIIHSRFSRIAVYGKTSMDIIGIVQNRELLREIAKDNYKAQVKDFMTKPIFVNWFIKADALLEKFIAHGQHLFIVQDSQGKNVGLVTMEDVLEELFGEIYDEKDMIKRHEAKIQQKTQTDISQQPKQ